VGNTFILAIVGRTHARTECDERPADPPSPRAGPAAALELPAATQVRQRASSAGPIGQQAAGHHEQTAKRQAPQPRQRAMPRSCDQPARLPVAMCG
jgi:hypothetical protein